MGDISVYLVDCGCVYVDIGYVFDGYFMGSVLNLNFDYEMSEFVVWNVVVDGFDWMVLWDIGLNLVVVDGYWFDLLYEVFLYVDVVDYMFEDDFGVVGYDFVDIDVVVMSYLYFDYVGGFVEFVGIDVLIYVYEEELKFVYYLVKMIEGFIVYFVLDFDYDLNWYVVYGDEYMLFDGF